MRGQDGQQDDQQNLGDEDVRAVTGLGMMHLRLGRPAGWTEAFAHRASAAGTDEVFAAQRGVLPAGHALHLERYRALLASFPLHCSID